MRKIVCRTCLLGLLLPLILLVHAHAHAGRHGIALLLTYKLGSSRLPESHNYTIDLKWLGLRPLQVGVARDVRCGRWMDGRGDTHVILTQR